MRAFDGRDMTSALPLKRTTHTAIHLPRLCKVILSCFFPGVSWADEIYIFLHSAHVEVLRSYSHSLLPYYFSSFLSPSPPPIMYLSNFISFLLISPLTIYSPFLLTSLLLFLLHLLILFPTLCFFFLYSFAN